MLMSKNVDGIILYVHTETYAFCKCLPTNVLAALSRFTAVCVFFLFWEREKIDNKFKILH